MRRLFNLLKEICSKIGLISDFIVSEGTSDWWTYRKWNSGVVECWGITPIITPKTTGSQWVVGNEGVQLKFPPGIFLDGQKNTDLYTQINCINYIGEAAYGYASTYNNPRSNIFIGCYNVHHVSATRYHVKVIGRWK